MKKLHLISEAHIDPIWQWDWEEGCAAAMATFRCAAAFCREFDNYIFCHNEALIYRWVEEYDPALFQEIQELVKLGKWHIMGGWHVQPDCNMPSGEAFARQIAEGRRYFREKFGAEPTTAINFDPFGHTRGLVQILAKSGYDSYLFVRPDPGHCPLPAETFRWVGYDGSSVIGQRSAGGYGTALGHAMDKVRPTTEGLTDAAPLGFCLWGVGNHGGGPSREDIRAINDFIAEAAESGVTVLHSTPEAYFADLRTAEAAAAEADESCTLPEHRGDLNPWAPGCYTSQVRIKQKYRLCENSLFSAEKMATHAAALGLMDYPEAELGQALYDLLTVQFHDVLPGSSIQPAEEGGLRMLDHALEILSRVRMRAFMALSAGQPAAAPGEFPILVYNPHPWRVETDVVCEFMLADQNWSGSYMQPIAYRDGQRLPTQCEKEDSNIPLDWRKRAVFHAVLEPSSMNRFDCRTEELAEKPRPDVEQYRPQGEPLGEPFGADGKPVLRIVTPRMMVEIGTESGLLELWQVDGQDRLMPGACRLEVMQDAEDSWGMTYDGWRERLGSFTLLSPEEGSRRSGLTAPIPSVRLIEDGEVRATIEAVFGYETSYAVVRYMISKLTPRINLEIRITNTTRARMIKLGLPLATPHGTPILETAFGEEPMQDGGRECVGQKYLTLPYADGGRLTLLDRGLYGWSREGDTLYLSLLRSPGYTAHPIFDRPTLPTDRDSVHMEQGERHFTLALLAGSATDTDMAREALAYNEQPFAINLFPAGGDAVRAALPTSEPFIRLSPSPVIMTACKPTSDGQGVMIRLFDPTPDSVECELSCPVLGISATLAFGPYEVKTFRVQDGDLIACRMDG